MAGAGWLKTHEKQVEIARNQKVRVALVGDSLIAGWSKTSWEKTWAPRGAANFGIAGDRTEHVLWRLRNGLLEAIDPDVVLLQVGTNDIKSGDIRRSPADTAAGIRAIVETIRAAKPKARIIVMAIFPRRPKYDWIDAAIQEANVRLAQIQREMADVLVVDIGIHFRGQNLQPSKVHLADDLLHLKGSGYDIWTQCVVDAVDAVRPRKDGRQEDLPAGGTRQN
jgi:lysophospholipase L1-like esterase